MIRPLAASWLLGCLVGGVAVSAAWSTTAETVPLPPSRPDRTTPQPPKPPHRPAPIGMPVADKPSVAAGSSIEGDDCLTRIARLGVRFEQQPDVQEGECGIRDAVLVSGLPDGVAVSPPSQMACPLAEALARWTIDVVLPEADRHFDSPPTRILIGTSYQCRNQRSGSKLSEHAFGNAVDVMGFTFHKHDPISVGFLPEGSSEDAFQAAVRTGACPLFSTVLGPGTDEDHADHLHLDLRNYNRGYRICQ